MNIFSSSPRNDPLPSTLLVVYGIVTEQSIIGTDRFTGGYGAAKAAHEQAVLSGPVPGLVLRAAQFHEFVAQLVEWGTQGDVAYVQKMRTQLVAARSVAAPRSGRE